jgi:hypothetical protein
MKERHSDIASALPANLDELPRLNGFRLRGLNFHQNRVADFPSATRVFALTHSRRKVCALQTVR